MVAGVLAGENAAAWRNVVAALAIRLELDAADGIFVDDAFVCRTAA